MVANGGKGNGSPLSDVRPWNDDHARARANDARPFAGDTHDAAIRLRAQVDRLADNALRLGRLADKPGHSAIAGNRSAGDAPVYSNEERSHKRTNALPALR